MLSFVQFITEEIARQVKWIYHPKTGPLSHTTSSERPYEHADLIGPHQKDIPYDHFHKGSAFVKNGKVYAWHQAHRTENHPDNQFNQNAVTKLLKHKYGTKITWHKNGIEAAGALKT